MNPTSEPDDETPDESEDLCERMGRQYTDRDHNEIRECLESDLDESSDDTLSTKQLGIYDSINC